MSEPATKRRKIENEEIGADEEVKSENMQLGNNTSETDNSENTQLGKVNASEDNDTSETDYSHFVNNLNTMFRGDTSLIKYPHPRVLSYVTPFVMAQRVAQWIKSCWFLHSRKRQINEIVDLTACIGGNTFEFAKMFPRVRCLEIDEESFKCLKHNIQVYGLQRKTKVTNENSMDWLFHKDYKIGETSVLFVDPPWGETKYQLEDIISDLYMTDSKGERYGVIDVINQAFSRNVGACVAKLPFNFDQTLFRKHFSIFYIMVYNKCLYVMVFDQFRARKKESKVEE